MSNKTTFYERLMIACAANGVSNMQQLSELLGYKSPEKLYRLERDEKARPSYAILSDIANKFENVDMNWLITGVGDMGREPGEEVSALKLLDVIEFIEDHETEFMQVRQFRRMVDRLATNEYIEKVMKEIEDIKRKISKIDPASLSNDL